MIEAELSVTAPGWMQDLSAKYASRINLRGCIPATKGRVRDLVEFTAPREKLGGLEEALRGNPELLELDVAPAGGNRLLATLSTNCPICDSLTGSECFLISSRLVGEKINLVLLVNGHKPLEKLARRLRSRGLGVEVEHMVELRGRGLTSRQEEIVKIAMEKGYFDYPKRTSIRELAALFGISIATLSEILRAGQKKILTAYFLEKGP